MPRGKTKFDRCVKAVTKRGGAYDPRAVCGAMRARGELNPAEYSFRLDRVKGETWGGGGKPMYALNEMKGSRLVRRFTGTRDEMVDLKRRMMSALKERARVTRMLERGRRNPAESSAEAYQRFHGRKPTQYVKVTKRIHHHANLWSVGDLESLKIRTEDGRSIVTLDQFNGTILAANPKAFEELRKHGKAKLTQLFVEGGDQRVKLGDFGIDANAHHELETLGKAIFIGYHTVKVHLGDEGGDAIYGHKFRRTRAGDKHVTLRVARYPDVIYRVLDKQLEFSGGSYEIRAEGIDK